MTIQSRRFSSLLSTGLLLIAGIQSVAASLPDFTVSGNVDLTVLLAESHSWSLDVTYNNFAGSDSDGLSFDVGILDFETCSTAAPDGLISPQLVDSSQATISALLQVDVPGVQASPLWTVQADTGMGELKFCISLSILYMGEIVNLVKTKAHLTVQNQEGAFVAFDGLVSSTASMETFGASQTISLGYPVRAYPCDLNSQEIVYGQENPPAPLEPGMAVRFCVALNEPTSGVHVQRMASTFYSSAVEGSTLETKLLTNEQGESVSNLAEVRCDKIPGVCQVEFVPLAAYFLEGEESSIKCSGSAVLAFGDDADGGRSRKLQHVQVDDSDLSESPFEYQLMLDTGAGKKSSKNSSSKQLNFQGYVSDHLAMGLAFLVGALLVVCSYHSYQCIRARKRSRQATKEDEEDSKDRATVCKDSTGVASGLPTPTGSVADSGAGPMDEKFTARWC